MDKLKELIEQVRFAELEKVSTMSKAEESAVERESKNHL